MAQKISALACKYLLDFTEGGEMNEFECYGRMFRSIDARAEHIVVSRNARDSFLKLTPSLRNQVAASLSDESIEAMAKVIADQDPTPLAARPLLYTLTNKRKVHEKLHERLSGRQDGDTLLLRWRGFTEREGPEGREAYPLALPAGASWKILQGDRILLVQGGGAPLKVGAYQSPFVVIVATAEAELIGVCPDGRVEGRDVQLAP